VLSVPGKGSTFFADLPCSQDRMKSGLESLSQATALQPKSTQPTAARHPAGTAQ
jgi:hypothetical protein